MIDTAGRLLGQRQFRADGAGYTELLAWLQSFGSVVVIGIEGTGAYGAGLARHLHAHGVVMLETDRPDRRTRRSAEKSDPIGAEAAARATLARTRTGTPKRRNGPVEALRNLRVPRHSAVDQRADCMRRIKTLIVTAPEQLRAQRRHFSDRQLLRPGRPSRSWSVRSGAADGVRATDHPPSPARPPTVP